MQRALWELYRVFCQPTALQEETRASGPRAPSASRPAARPSDAGGPDGARRRGGVDRPTAGGPPPLVAGGIRICLCRPALRSRAVPRHQPPLCRLLGVRLGSEHLGGAGRPQWAVHAAPGLRNLGAHRLRLRGLSRIGEHRPDRALLGRGRRARARRGGPPGMAPPADALAPLRVRRRLLCAEWFIIDAGGTLAQLAASAESNEKGAKAPTRLSCLLARTPSG